MSALTAESTRALVAAGGSAAAWAVAATPSASRVSVMGASQAVRRRNGGLMRSLHVRGLRMGRTGRYRGGASERKARAPDSASGELTASCVAPHLLAHLEWHA